MKNDLIENIKTKFAEMGQIYCVFEKGNRYAVSFKGTSETICVFE